MKTIVLYTIFAHPCKGKTTLIEKMLKIIAENREYKVLPCGEMTEANALKCERDVQRCITKLELSLLGDRGTETKGILEIGGKRVGIYTTGDAPHFLRDAMYFFAAHECDIGIHASRTTAAYTNCITEMCKLLETAPRPALMECHDLLEEENIRDDDIRSLTDERVAALVAKVLGN